MLVDCGGTDAINKSKKNQNLMQSTLAFDFIVKIDIF